MVLLNAGPLLVTEYFYSVVLVFLVQYKLSALLFIYYILYYTLLYYSYTILYYI